MSIGAEKYRPCGSSTAGIGIAGCYPTTRPRPYLTCSVLGHDLDAFWCTPDVPVPADRWDWSSFHSASRFDFEREGVLLRAVLAHLDR